MSLTDSSRIDGQLHDGDVSTTNQVCTRGIFIFHSLLLPNRSKPGPPVPFSSACDCACGATEESYVGVVDPTFNWWSRLGPVRKTSHSLVSTLCRRFVRLIKRHSAPFHLQQSSSIVETTSYFCLRHMGWIQILLSANTYGPKCTSAARSALWLMQHAGLCARHELRYLSHLLKSISLRLRSRGRLANITNFLGGTIQNKRLARFVVPALQRMNRLLHKSIASCVDWFEFHRRSYTVMRSA